MKDSCKIKQTLLNVRGLGNECWQCFYDVLLKLYCEYILVCFVVIHLSSLDLGKVYFEFKTVS